MEALNNNYNMFQDIKASNKTTSLWSISGEEGINLIV